MAITFSNMRLSNCDISKSSSIKPFAGKVSAGRSFLPDASRNLSNGTVVARPSRGILQLQRPRPQMSLGGRMPDTAQQQRPRRSQLRTATYSKELKPVIDYGVPLLLGCGLLLTHPAEQGVQDFIESWRMASSDLAAASWQGYNHLLETQPVLTKVSTGLAGCFLGDLLAQVSGYVLADMKHKQEGGYEEEAPVFAYNAGHVSRLLLYSALTTPLVQYWYLLLDSMVMPSDPTSPQAVLLKVACDQGFMTPIMTLLFFTCMKLMEDVTGGLPRNEITPSLLMTRVKSVVSSKYVPTMKACYMVWPLAHVVNFAFIPSSQRILYINAIAIMWTAYLSLQTAAADTKENQL